MQSGLGSKGDNGGGRTHNVTQMNGHTQEGDALKVLPIEWTHRGGGRTHNVTQQTDTHIFTGGGRTHNVTQRTDTQIFF